MSENISIKEVSVEEAVKVNAAIVEFDDPCSKEYFENRYEKKEKLIIVGYIDNEPAGYLVGYDKFGDGSFYCWMTGVSPIYRKKGLLKALMDYEEKWAKEKGYKKIKIKTRNSRREMLAYLVKYDFLFTEVEQRSDIRDNRIMLEKSLILFEK